MAGNRENLRDKNANIRENSRQIERLGLLVFLSPTAPRMVWNGVFSRH
jgi:hypothetical protein